MPLSAHDQIIDAINRVLQPAGGELRLLARVNDPILGNPSSREAFLLIPDLHILSPARAGAFGRCRFNFDQQGVLASILEGLAELREAWEGDGAHKLVTIQLGDFFDLWRELSSKSQIPQISDDAQGRIRDVLYRGIHRGRPCLRATMLLGNHDTIDNVSLPEIDFRLKAFNRAANGRPFLFATHGDAFDLLESALPDWMQQFVVHMIGRLTPSNVHSIAMYGELAERTNAPPGAMVDAIVGAEHALSEMTAGAVRVTAGAPLPNRIAEVISDPALSSHKYFSRFYESVGRARVLGLDGGSVQVVAIGHTHHARIVVCTPPNGGRSMVLLDAGAWIEKCRYRLDDGTEIIEPNAQLAVIHGNDARIYQVRPGAI